MLILNWNSSKWTSRLRELLFSVQRLFSIRREFRALSWQVARELQKHNMKTMLSQIPNRRGNSAKFAQPNRFCESTGLSAAAFLLPCLNFSGTTLFFLKSVGITPNLSPPSIAPGQQHHAQGRCSGLGHSGLGTQTPGERSKQSGFHEAIFNYLFPTSPIHRKFAVEKSSISPPSLSTLTVQSWCCF